MNELISVIIPVYKVEKYLSKCIDSVLNQTYSNLEIILVDDGSPDNCGVICDEYAKNDNRIKVIHKENGGQADARNIGIGIATGEYVAFVDSDDYLNKKMYEVLYNLSKEQKADAVFCELQRFSEDEIVNEDCNSNHEIKVLTKVEALDEILFNDNVGNYLMPKLYKRNIIEGIYFPKGRMYEDVATLFKMIDRTEKVVYTTQKLYYYLYGRVGATTSTFTPKKILDSLQSYYEQYDFINSNYREMSEKISLVFAKMYTSVMEKICINEYYDMLEIPEIKEKYNTFKNAFLKINFELMQKYLNAYRSISMIVLNQGIDTYKELIKELIKLK